MVRLFELILRMSATGSIAICAVLLVRWLLGRAPRKYAYLLWIVVGFRLACPVSFHSAFSLFSLRPAPVVSLPAPAPIPPVIPVSVPPSPPPSTLPVTPTPPMPSSPAVDGMQVLSLLWLAGMVLLAGYSVLREVQLRRQLATATRLEGNIYCSETVRSPFLLGLVRPRIYIPYGLDPQTQRFVLAHEQCHLRRWDHMTRRIGFLLLTIHWFNPLCWLAFLLCGKDMELSCDEAVLRQEGVRSTDYSTALLTFAVNRRLFSPAPLAFGETGVKTRIQNILHWKRPTRIMTAAASVLCCGVLIACAANPQKPADTPLQAALRALDTTDWSTLPCQVFQESSDPPMLPPSDRLAPLADQLIPDEDVRLLPQQGVTVLWNDGTQSIRLLPAEPPGIIQLQYESGDTHQMALAENMEIYIWLIAADQCPGVELTDIDGDGFWESFYYAPTLDIYDYYDGQIQMPTLPDRGAHFVKGCISSELLNADRQFLLYMAHEGDFDMFSYRDGKTTFVCTTDEAYREDAHIDDYDAYIEARRAAPPPYTLEDVVFTQQPLSLTPDLLTYDQRLDWIHTTEPAAQTMALVSLNESVEGEGCLAYVSLWHGAYFDNQYALHLRFPDGTVTQLPLPKENLYDIRKPDHMEFRDGRFLYTLRFSEEFPRKHLKGNYCYEVDLDTKTISLQVEQ